MTKKIQKLVRLGNVYITDYILNECNLILEEQRKIDVQINLRKACQIIRGQQLTKQRILEFVNALNDIHFNETLKIKKFKNEINEIYTLYEEYYTNNGIRKH